MTQPDKVNIQAPRLLFLFFSSFLLLFGCSQDSDSTFNGCVSCHKIKTDSAHQIGCTTCHQGDSSADTESEAHFKFIAAPAHPDHMEKTCGSCHADIVEKFSHSLHLTLSNKVNMVRAAYGATDTISDLTSIPVREDVQTPLHLADDMLRRRCLRCHLYSAGDDYTGTGRAKGCGACHLEYEDGMMRDHTFTKYPSDSSCLSCHYGNYVGFDYYGRFEHDLNAEYRTPYGTDGNTRPYGVESHQLAPDIHQQRGMVCIDCHKGRELMGEKASTAPISCSGCHDKEQLEQNPVAGTGVEQGTYTFTSLATGNKHTLPVMTHPAHKGIGDQVTCQVCHAQWSFNDTATHLLRSDLDEYDIWSRLTVQGSSEVEKFLEHNLDYDNEELPPAMSDKITGDIRMGVWYKGYTMRRWEGPLLGRDKDNAITVVRPIMNISLSWIDEDENVRFDSYESISPNSGVRPYTPHTTGAAGLFYEQRIRNYTASENQTIQSTNPE